MTVQGEPDKKPVAPAGASRSNVPIFLIFGVAAVVLLAAVAYSMMMAAGPMPGMNH